MKLNVRDIEVNYHIFHRNVKYARLEIKNGELNIIIPPGMKDYHQFIQKHENWIYRKISRVNSLKDESKKRDLNYHRDDDEFRQLVLNFTDGISKKMGLTVNKVTLRKMKTRWGSCSSKGNISINKRLKYLPEQLIEYVVHHELCHFKIRKHNRDYWKLVALKYPDYKKYEEELSIYWFLVKELD